METQVERKANRKQSEDQEDDKPWRKEQLRAPLFSHLSEGVSQIDWLFTTFWFLKGDYSHIAPSNRARVIVGAGRKPAPTWLLVEPI